MLSNQNLIKKLLIIAIFASAMAFLESTVVVYLRMLFYPEGFAFPINVNFPPQLLRVELLRELSTILMLACIGLLVGRTLSEKVAYFLYTFGIWDIFYYIGLKTTLDWPGSVFTWDLLFLIPVVWVGPVLAPVTCSLTMIFLAVNVTYLTEQGYAVTIKVSEWVLCLLGAFLIFVSFIYDYTNLFVFSTNKDYLFAISQYVPTKYNWWLLVVGELLILSAFGLFYRRIKFLPGREIIKKGGYKRCLPYR